MNVLWGFQSIPRGNITESVLFSARRGFVTVIHIKPNENYWHKYLVHQDTTRPFVLSIFITAQAPPLPFFFFFIPIALFFFFFWWKIAWGKSSLTNHDVPLSSTAETDPLPCSESLDATLKFYWDSYWVGREPEAFLLSGFNSRLFTVWMEDERKARRKKAVKWGLQEERGEWERTGRVCALIKAKYTIKS